MTDPRPTGEILQKSGLVFELQVHGVLPVIRIDHIDGHILDRCGVLVVGKYFKGGGTGSSRGPVISPVAVSKLIQDGNPLAPKWWGYSMPDTVGEWFSDCTRNITALVIEESRSCSITEESNIGNIIGSAIQPASGTVRIDGKPIPVIDPAPPPPLEKRISISYQPGALGLPVPVPGCSTNCH